MDINTALIVVDMQNYYLNPESDFYRFAVSRVPDSMDYISQRCSETVIPNIKKLLHFFRSKNLPVFFLRLCGKHPERKDLHRFFKKEYQRGKEQGFDSVYPVSENSMADIIPELSPLPKEAVINKTTFSAFSSTEFQSLLQKGNIQSLVFCGLATSQCVETTARDASDIGFSVIHIENAQADYTDTSHRISIYSSASVCGGWIYDTQSFIDNYFNILSQIRQEEAE